MTTESNSENGEEINLEENEPEVEQEINTESGDKITTNESNIESEEENMVITNDEMHTLFTTFMEARGAHLTNLAIGLKNATAINWEVRNKVQNLITGQAN